MSEALHETRSGGCLCGDIRFIAEGVRLNMSVCHCGQCRRWTGGPYFSVHVGSLRFENDARPRAFRSSDVAERAACERCGSPIFWRMTLEGPYKGTTSVALGVLDDQQGFTLEREWFHDQKPSAYDLAGERECVTEAQALSMLDAAT